MRLLRRDPERIAVDRAVFFSRQMLGRFGRETIERGDKGERRLRTRHPISFHQIFGQEQISDRGQNRQEQNADGVFALIEQALHEIGPRTGIDEVTTFVAALAQSKKAGRGLEATLRDQELMVRLTERNRATAQAASVSTKLLGVLGGIYLPEFVILIIIPLFWGIMQRAFG